MSDTSPIYGINANKLTAVAVDANGNLIVSSTSTPPQSTHAFLSNVASSTSSTTLSFANTGRLGWYVFNDSTAILYLAFASTASTTAYTVQIPANSFYEMPPEPVYTGTLSGIWSSANGNARITELT